MRIFVALAALVVLAVSPWPAHAAELDSLRGRYAFNWLVNPDTVKCRKIGKSLLAKFKSSTFTCDLTPDIGSSTGAPHSKCTEAGEKSEYLIFSTKAECEEERKAQASNE